MGRLHVSSKNIGFTICRREGPSCCGLNSGEKGFVRMGAVVENHGAWDDFLEYTASEKHSSVSRVPLMAYPMLARMSDRNI